MAEGVIRAKLRNENDYDELLEMFRDNPPVEADRDNLLVEINIVSHGEREVILDFLIGSIERFQSTIFKRPPFE